MPEARDFICGNWVWDSGLRELRTYRQKGKADEPEAVERLEPARRVVWQRWSQAPMQTATGGTSPPTLSRIVVEYERGGELTINENDRECAEKLARAIAASFGLDVVEDGAPGGRRRGNVPSRDDMGRLVAKTGKLEVVLDEAAGMITVTEPKRFFRKARRMVQTNEVRRLELAREVKGPVESFTLWAVLAGEEDRIPVARYEGYEGWADPEEWEELAEELGRWLGVEWGSGDR